jgi:hypothetical protein
MYPVWMALALLAADPPPEREKALRAAVDQFATAFQEGKLRKAYPLVDEDSQEAFLDMAKIKFSKYEWTKLEWSEDFTRANVTLTVDTEWKLPQATIPVRRPWDQTWIWKDGAWVWIWDPPKEIDTPFGRVKVGTAAKNVDVEAEIRKGPKPEDLDNAITVTTPELIFRRSEPREAEIQVKNGLSGHVNLTVYLPRIPGMKIDRIKKSAGPGETIAFRLYWNPVPGEAPAERIPGAVTGEPVGGMHGFVLIFSD